MNGIRIGPSYSGTITQNSGFTIALGTVGWVQTSGTFAGGNSTISTDYFVLAGGTFTSTTDILKIGNFKQWGSMILNVAAAATFNHNNGTLEADIQGACYQAAVFKLNGGLTVNNFTLNGIVQTNSCGSSASLSIGSDTLTILGNFNDLGGHANNGTYLVSGNLTGAAITGGNYGIGSTGVIRLVGNAAGQTITGVAGGRFPTVEIATGTNPVTLSGTIGINNSWTLISVGTFTSTGSTLAFDYPQDYVGNTITPGTVIYNDVSFNGNATSWTFSPANSIMSIAGSVYFSGGYPSINSGTFLVAGNMNSSVSSSNGSNIGNALVQFTGSGNQTVTSSGAGSVFPGGNITINKSGGTFTLASNVSFNNNGQTLTLSLGSINMAGYALTLKALSLSGNVLTKNTGVLSVNGSVVGTGSLYGGTVNP